MDVVTELRAVLDGLVADHNIDTSTDPNLVRLCAVIAHFESKGNDIVFATKHGFSVVFTPADMAAEPRPEASRVEWVKWWRNKTGASLSESMRALERRIAFGSIHALQGYV